MNIVLINHYAGSPDMGMEFRPYYFAREWVKQGHTVHIIAADYSHLRRKNPTVSKDFEKEVIDGITYWWVKTIDYGKNGGKRAITMGQFVGKLCLHAKKIVKIMQPDVVITSSTYPIDTFAGQRIRRKSKKKVKLIHEVHDMWPATLIELGGMSKYNPFVIAMQIGENSAYKKADYVLALLEYSEPHMQEHGLKKGKFKCVPLGVDLNEWEEKEPLNEVHQQELDKIKREGKFVVGYFGGHAMSNALDILIDVAEKVNKKEKNIQFVLVGSGVEKERLKQMVLKKQLGNVTFLPPVGKKEIPELVQYFDCIYIGTYKNNLYRFGLCLNKMLDAMMSQKPVVCSLTAPPSWIEKANSGIVVEAENPTKIYDAILKVYEMSEQERASMGRRGVDYVKEHLDIEKLAKEVLDIMKTLRQ